MTPNPYTLALISIIWGMQLDTIRRIRKIEYEMIKTKNENRQMEIRIEKRLRNE
ncbi:MAG: hypothetical protein QXL94_09220 [Candidatus Parvarchaeum sp.]